MSDIKIGPGPGNLTPFSDYRQFMCRGAITKGMAVAFDPATHTSSYDNLGYTILAASATVGPVIGIAMETGAAGQWIKVCVEGFCNYVTVTAATDTHVLVGVASGGTTSYVLGTDEGTRAALVYGVALADAVATTLSSAWIHRKVAETDIPAGPGNLKGEQEYKEFLVGTAVTRGQVVKHAEGSITGYTIAPCEIVASPYYSVPIGVAAESGAAGTWVKVLVAGYCDWITNTDATVTAGQLLHAVAAGAVAPLAVNTNIAAQHPGIIGTALRTDTGTVSAGYIFKRL